MEGLYLLWIVDQRGRWLLRNIIMGLYLVFIASVTHAGVKVSPVWSEQFVNGLNGWKLTSAWGTENAKSFAEQNIPGNVLRVRYPAGSLDPATMRKEGRPYGGMGFKKAVFDKPATCAELYYRVRFPIGFDFVRGGKLPGLYGGTGNSGGHIPTGKDGFSTRYMWLDKGRGQIYAYLPTSVNYGTSIGKGQFVFIPGRWHELKQQVVLNVPGVSNGIIRVWLDGRIVVEKSDIRFRDLASLGITGIFFDTFFGGNDDTWRTKVDTYVDFADFKVYSCQ
jgi:hypothetical protein